MNDYGLATEAGTVRFERLLPGPIERVWDYLTESQLRGKWLASGHMDMRIGGQVELQFRNSDLSPIKESPPEKYKELEGLVTMHGRITALEPPRLLAYTWGEGASGSSEVTFELTPRGEQVLLVLTHRRLADRELILSVAGGWHTHLAILLDHLNGVPPRPFWSTHAKLEKEYEQRLAETLG